MTTDFDNLMEYQNMLQNNLAKERKINKKIELLSIINQMTTGPKNIVQKEQIIIEAESKGFTEKEIESILAELKKDNIIYEPSPGYIKKK
ncbi:hypothetical protein GF327_06505 [Candidatus Woesearchaeota archaeon]|nr:hypothetical protein [Candidatus Woesearchaeota archaeon]